MSDFLTPGDFLTQLVGRSVNRVLVVQPRLASRFEAIAAPKLYPNHPIARNPSDAAVWMAEESAIGLSELASGQEAIQPVVSPPYPPAFQGGRDRMEQRQPEVQFTDIDRDTEGAIANSPLEPPSNPNRFRQRETPVAEPRSLPQPLPATPATPSSLLSPPPAPAASSTFPPHAPASVQPPINSIQPAERATPPELEPSPPQPAPGSFATPLSADDRPIAPISVRVHPQIRPRVEPSPSRFSAPPPTIQVTIGRIEVRAAAASVPAPAPPHRAPPTLTLADYLRQRTGGPP